MWVWNKRPLLLLLFQSTFFFFYFLVFFAHFYDFFPTYSKFPFVCVFVSSTQLTTPVNSCGAATTTTLSTVRPRKVHRSTGQSVDQERWAHSQVKGQVLFKWQEVWFVQTRFWIQMSCKSVNFRLIDNFLVCSSLTTLFQTETPQQPLDGLWWKVFQSLMLPWEWQTLVILWHFI